MSEPTIQFKIIPGGSRTVDVTKVVSHAILFFSIPKCDISNGDVCTVQVNGLTVRFSRTFSCGYQEGSRTLFLDQFGKFGGNNRGPSDFITELMANNDKETIIEAFRQLAEKLQDPRGQIPPTAINLLGSSVLPLVTMDAWFDLQPAETKTVQKTIGEPDDIFFDIDGFDCPTNRTSVTVDGLKLTIGGGLSPYYDKASKGAHLWIKDFGYYKDSHGGARTQKAIRKMRAEHSDGTIEAAFQQLALQILQKSEPSKKRKAPADAKVWTPSIVTEIDLSKRLKATEIKSESMTE